MVKLRIVYIVSTEEEVVSSTWIGISDNLGSKESTGQCMEGALWAKQEMSAKVKKETNRTLRAISALKTYHGLDLRDVR